MGKGKKPYGRKLAVAADSSDEYSETTPNGHGGAAHEAEDAIDDTYHDNLEALFEKRGSTRLKAYSNLIAFLKSDLRDMESEKNCNMLVSRVLDSMRRGSVEERCLAAVALALHMVSLPEVPENLYAEIRGLMEIATIEGPHEARAIIVEALCMCCYVGAQDDLVTRDLMDKLQILWRKGEGVSRAAALRGWSLLFTSLSGVLSSADVEVVLSKMAGYMSADKSVDVRTAAGEVVALLCSSYKFLQAWADADDEDYDYDDDDGDDASMDSLPVSVTGTEVPDSLDELVYRMRDLATHNRHDSLRTSKRNKAALKTTFRGVLASVESGHVKAEKIKLKHGDVLCVDTLTGKVTLSAFKRLLQGGLQAHLLANPLLHAVFAFSPTAERPDRLSALEKRHFQSKNSSAAREQTERRKGDRSWKSQRRAAAAADGGVDW